MMSNHISLLKDLDAGKDCSAEAAAAIRDLEARVEELEKAAVIWHRVEDKEPPVCTKMLIGCTTKSECLMDEHPHIDFMYWESLPLPEWVTHWADASFLITALQGENDGM